MIDHELAVRHLVATRATLAEVQQHLFELYARDIADAGREHYLLDLLDERLLQLLREHYRAMHRAHTNGVQQTT